jgi:hypothetical protein
MKGVGEIFLVGVDFDLISLFLCTVWLFFALAVLVATVNLRAHRELICQFIATLTTALNYTIEFLISRFAWYVPYQHM